MARLNAAAVVLLFLILVVLAWPGIVATTQSILHPAPTPNSYEQWFRSLP